MSVSTQDTASTPPTAGKPCSGCQGPRTRGEGQRYCHECHAEAQARYRTRRNIELREFRQKVRAELAERFTVSVKPGAAS